jgi:hypothetical protein
VADDKQPRFSSGDWIALCGGLLGVAVSWGVSSQRITQTETALAALQPKVDQVAVLEQRVMAQELRHTELRSEIKESLAEIRQDVRAIRDKVGADAHEQPPRRRP